MVGSDWWQGSLTHLIYKDTSTQYEEEHMSPHMSPHVCKQRDSVSSSFPSEGMPSRRVPGVGTKAVGVAHVGQSCHDPTSTPYKEPQHKANHPNCSREQPPKRDLSPTESGSRLFRGSKRVHGPAGCHSQASLQVHTCQGRARNGATCHVGP